MYGQFFGGDSYIVLYSYKDARGKDAAFIYFWQGLKSTQDEIGTSAIKAKELDDEMGGYPVQVRVVQNKEPAHFCLIFKDRLIVHLGGIGSGFKNSSEQTYQDDDGTRLFHVRGTDETNVRAVQVEEKAASLNAGDCFILESPARLYLWFGTGCLKEERAFTIATYKNIDRMNPKHLSADPEVVMEGRETADFWAALGGKTAYQTGANTSEDARDPRLFQCSNNKGYFYADEVLDFDQSDLIEDDVMLLDAYTEVFVWIGKGANVEERKEAMNLAKTYVDEDPTGRKSADTSFMVIKQSFEPPNFTCHFMAWDDSKWRGGKTYEEMKAEISTSNPGEALLATSMDAEMEKFAPGGMILPYAQLLGSDLPAEIDQTAKEDHLSPEDFMQHFKMDRAKWDGLPKWKKIGLKKKAKLY